MAAYLDLFSPETYARFSASDRTVTGFRTRHRKAAQQIRLGDRFLCYVTRISRWVGVLEVQGSAFEDGTSRFADSDQIDPFVVRFTVKPLVWLKLEHGIPIRDDSLFERLSFTKGRDKNTSAWTGPLRGSLYRLTSADAELVLQRLITQQSERVEFELTELDREKLKTHHVRRHDKTVSVSVPEQEEPESDTISADTKEIRESLKVQAVLAEIGAKMGMRVWLPRSDRAAVLSEWPDRDGALLESLPLNYDDTTLKTIEQIDVLWLRRRSIVRAFEVEHTTSVYSGILRMADLLALQPNMDIKLHLVAPPSRREKVFQELRRPVFSLLEKGPLSESCTYLSYDSIQELREQKHLVHMGESVLDEYAEVAE